MAESTPQNPSWPDNPPSRTGKKSGSGRSNRPNPPPKRNRTGAPGRAASTPSKQISGGRLVMPWLLAALLLSVFISADRGMAQSLVGSWEGVLEEEEFTTVIFDLKEGGRCEMVVTVAAEDTFLFRTTYWGSWATAGDSLHVSLESGQIEVNEIIVGEALPLLLAGIIAGLTEWLSGEEISEEELTALVEELKGEIESELAAISEGLAQDFSLRYELMGDTLSLHGEETEELVLQRRATSVAAASWGQIKNNWR